MRSSLTRGGIAKALATVATAALLAGCSNSIERFAAAYNNPSDADPVYTASVPKSVQAKKPVYKAPAPEVADADIIEESPVERAAVPMAKPKDYASAYKPAYKQPAFTASKPKLVLPQEEPDVADNSEAQDDYVAPVAVKAPFKQAKPAKIKLVEPQEEDVAVVETPAPKKVIKFNKPKIIAPAEEDVADVEPVAKSVAPSKAGVHTVGSGDTLFALGRKYGVSPYAIAEANGFDNSKQLSIGEKVKIPGGKVIARAPVEEETTDVADVAPVVKKKTAVAPAKKAPLSLAEDEQVASDDQDAEPAIGEAPKKQVAAVQPKIKEPVMAEAPASPSGLSLRWPLKGKVISGYGTKPGGLKNEGINISVPEGTSIRAAEGGVVAYAGNELKGYGNLVLIRHAGGYVTAYAHAKELLVKRGDTVERGGIIGKAGQTGSVSSPQLHFEVRKGATALDPNKYLTSTTASN